MPARPRKQSRYPAGLLDLRSSWNFHAAVLPGITNPTPSAALGAADAIMRAASFAIVIMLLFGVTFDLRVLFIPVGAEGTTRHTHTGVIPFVLIPVAALLLSWLIRWIVTIVPNLLG